jgi:outer membrane protein OmpA-like peptidoglycan-associated protein
MRKVITAVSFMLSGASVLIFILALLIPLLRETPSLARKSESKAYESADSLKKTIEGLASKHAQSPAVNNEIQPSITQSQTEVKQNQSNGLPASTQPIGTPGFSSTVAPHETVITQNRGESSAMHSLQNSPETTIPQINEKSAGPINSLAGKGETEAYESPNSLKKTIEGLAPKHAQSPAINNEIQPSITQPQAEVMQNQSNGLPASTQPVGTPGFSSTVAPNETIITQNRGESSAMQSLQNSPETTVPQIDEKSTGPINLLAEKGETETYESAGPLKKTIEENVIQPSITQPQAEVMQNQSHGLPASAQPVGTPGFSSTIAPNETAIAQNRGESSAMQSLQNSSESTIPQINENSTGPTNPIVAEEKRSPPHEPMSLLVLGDGLFPVREEKPKANMQKAIDKIIPLIKERSLDKVVVEGHADKWIPNGVSAVRVSNFNKIVSLQRAKAVAKVLEQKGVARDRIIVKGLGDAVPLASNQTNKGRKKNRRVEIKLVPTQ